MTIKLMQLNDLQGHDVYEFCRDSSYPNHWNNDSLFMNSDDFILLSPYLDKVFSNFHYYGDQKITYSQWNKIKQHYTNDANSDSELAQALTSIDTWLNSIEHQENIFWILGI